MAHPPTELPAPRRDGTSQAGRVRAELDPAAVGLDERTTADLLTFVRAHATRLIYYDGENRPAGDWSGLFAGLTDEQILGFVDTPRPDADARLRRPHFVLLLALLRLLATARDAMSGLTRRHLDYYCREVLRLTGSPPRPDRVCVLFDLADGADPVRLTAGTLLAAGRDAARRDRFYATESDLIVTRTRVARVSSVFADKRVVGLAEARTAPVGTKEERFLAMLKLALGEPEPGGDLPAYDGQAITYARLQTLAVLARFAWNGLFLRQFELRQLIDRKHTRDTADADWTRINADLRAAGRAQRNDPNWPFNPANPRDFNANLTAALNGPLDLSGLPEIATVDDLYVQRYRQDAQNAIVQKLFMSVDQFVAMMDLKRASDTDWRVVNSLLELAGQRKRNDSAFRLVPAGPSNFAANMTTALGPVNFAAVGVASIDAYAAAVAALEPYLHMPAETFADMMATADRPEAQVAERTWHDIYGTLEEAHRQKVFAARRDTLRKTREAAADPAAGLRAILAQALGETSGAATGVLLEEFDDLVSPAELAALRTMAASPATAPWPQAYDILERAWRKRAHLPDPVARRDDWLNLYAYADATTVRPATGDTPRWKTFGAAPATQSQSEPPPAIIGLAIGSPLFALSTGTRRITITVGFFDDGGGPVLATTETALSVQVSTAKGWITPTNVAIAADAAVDYTKLDGIAPLPAGTKLLGLRVVLTLPTNAPAIAPGPADVGLAGCPWPAVRITPRQIWDPVAGRFVIRYPRLHTLRIARVHLRAATGGYAAAPPSDPVAPLWLENDAGPIDGKRPFDPFGTQPAAGAMLWVSHPDLQRKRLLSLRLLLTWMGGPAKLSDIYASYPDLKDKNFTAQVSLADAGVPRAQGNPLPLFAGAGQNTTQPQTMEIASATDSLAPYDTPDGTTPAQTARQMPRAVRLELTPVGFGHQEYPALATAAAIRLAADSANAAAKLGPNAATPLNASSYVVAPPYTPKLKSLALEFIAGHELRMDADQAGPATDMVFHIHPFGVAEARASVDGFPFLPDYGNEGELLIGLAGVQPPETVSLLFQMADGSANPDAKTQPVVWSVLDARGWSALPGESIVADGTRGLVNSGIAVFALPPATSDSRLPDGLYWLRAAVLMGAAGVCDTIAIEAQAVMAQRQLAAGAAPDPTPLPPQTIRTPVVPIASVAKVRQPYSSFGGRQAEPDSAFYTAASERLRHRQRPVTAWDYERLVLRRFPEVYKVKCLSARLADAPAGTDDRDIIGVVRLIVIPDIRGKSLFDPFSPKASSALLADIAEYLTPLLPGTARLRVENAAYVQIRVRVGVRFTDPNNPAFSKRRLNDELNRYLSPWAFDDGADIVIGRRIYASSIVHFIDQRPYVDYVAGIKLFSSDDGTTFTLAPANPAEGDSIGSDRPDAVLVAARQHEIDLIADEIYAQDQFKGVNYMKVELDFVVG